MYSVADVVAAFGCSKQTVRVWATEFSPFLSPGADPPKGQAREFTPDDIRVFALVSQMRDEGSGYKDISASLSAGQRGELPPKQERRTAGTTSSQYESQETSLAPIEILERYALQVQGHIKQVEGERDYLRGQIEVKDSQIEAERAARLEAEKRAAAAETEVKVLREVQSVRGEQEAKGEGSQVRPSWWQRLRGRG